MWPTLYEFQTASGPVGVHSYGLLVLSAFCAAFVIVHGRALKMGIAMEKMLAVYVMSGAAGMFGGHLLYVLAVHLGPKPNSELNHFWSVVHGLLADPLVLFKPQGFAVYGGILGGIAGVYGVAHALKIPKWTLADIAAPAAVTAMGIGRFACFFAGCCHGDVVPDATRGTGLLPEGLLSGQIWLQGAFPFITLEFHDGVGRLLHQPLYPTQLWSAAAGIGIGGFLVWLWNHRRFDGMIAGLVLATEPITRIIVESFRADHRGYLVSWPVSADLAAALPPGLSKAGAEFGTAMIGVTTSQAIGLAMVLSGVVILLIQRRSTVEQAVEVSEADELDAIEI